MHLRRYLLLLAGVVLFHGCGKPESPAEEMFRQGMELKAADEYQDALRVFRKAIDLDPNYENAYLHIALIYDDYLQDKNQAVEWYEKYLKVATNEQQKERVQRWLAEARQVAAQTAETTAAAAALPPEVKRTVDTQVAQERARLDREYKTKEQVLAGQYESQLDDLKEEVRTLKRANMELKDESDAIKLERDSLQRRVADATGSEQVLAMLESPQYTGSEGDLKATIAKLNIEIEKLKKQLAQGSSGDQTREAELVKLRQQVAAAQHAERTRSEEGALRTRVSELQAQNRQLATRVAELEAALGEEGQVARVAPESESELQRLQQRNEELENQVTRALADKQLAENALADLSARTDAVIADMAASSGQDIETENRRLRLQIAKITSQFQDSTAQRDAAQDRARQLEQEVEAMRNVPPAAQPVVAGDFSDLSEEIVRMQETIEAQKKLLDEQDGRIAQLTQHNFALERDTAQQAAAGDQPLIEQLNRQLADKDRQLSARNSQLQELRVAYDNANSRIESLEQRRVSLPQQYVGQTSQPLTPSGSATVPSPTSTATVRPAPATSVTPVYPPPSTQRSAQEYSRVFYPESAARPGQATVASVRPAATVSYNPARTTRQPRAYRVRSGDTLSGIAGKVYGDRNKWNIIYAANRDLLPRADSLRIGQVLYIPPQ